MVTAVDGEYASPKEKFIKALVRRARYLLSAAGQPSMLRNGKKRRDVLWVVEGRET